MIAALWWECSKSRYSHDLSTGEPQRWNTVHTVTIPIPLGQKLASSGALKLMVLIQTTTQHKCPENRPNYISRYMCRNGCQRETLKKVICFPIFFRCNVVIHFVNSLFVLNTEETTNWKIHTRLFLLSVALFVGVIVSHSVNHKWARVCTRTFRRTERRYSCFVH